MHPEIESPATSISNHNEMPHFQPPPPCVESSGWRPIGRQSIFMRSNDLYHRSPRLGAISHAQPGRSGSAPNCGFRLSCGLDIAKNVVQVHGVDAEGAVVIRRRLRRGHVIAFFEKLPPCLVGIEACATSHYQVREIAKFCQLIDSRLRIPLARRRCWRWPAA